MLFGLLPLICSVAVGAASPVGVPVPDAGAFGPAGDSIPTLQALHSDLPDVPFLPLPILGREDEDRLRLAHLTRGSSTRGFLLRSPSTLSVSLGYEPFWDVPAENAVFWSLLSPELRTVWNSDLPHSMNQGSLWAGRGLSTQLTAGVRFRFRNAALILAPHVVREENRAFQTASFPEAGLPRDRHVLASLFHYPPASMDLPLRFGTEPRTFLELGQSSFTVRTGRVAFGAATENLWWGPGIRNGLLMSAQAPGIPHLFLRTERPLETRAGNVEARWLLGRLVESDYFDFDPENDHRSLSALALTLAPAFEPNLTIGVARAVYAPSGRLPLGSALDVFRSAGRPSTAPGDTLLAPDRDQLFTLFARWVFPGAGFEAFGEWGRYEQPKSLRDLLELPDHSRGYTVGMQYARSAPGSTHFRFQTEITNLEPSTSYRIRPPGEWYASRAVPQGYTHRGRTIGAAIGPSGSSQWLAADVLGRRWSAGVYGARIRWENEALYTYLPEFRRADVTLLMGVRATAQAGPLRVSAEYAPSIRLNYLFQAQPVSDSEDRGVDIRNHTVQVTLASGRPLP